MLKQNASAKIKARYAFVGVVVLCVLIGYGAYRNIFDNTIEKEAARHRQNLETVSLSINATLSKYEELPLAIAKDARIHAALNQKSQPAQIGAANQYLAEINQILGTDTIYIMNRDGLTLASSNWDQPDSYVGDNYSFRPYFTGAMQSGIGKFYGIGVASGITKMGITELTVAVWPWLLTMLVFLVVVTYWPGLSLWFPRMLGMIS